ncbi:hypothetical protein D3C80_2116790 [compost metagenome]
MYMTLSAFGTSASGTKRMRVAVASAQKPPMVMPSKARAAINTPKFGAHAIRISESSITAVSVIST